MSCGGAAAWAGTNDLTQYILAADRNAPEAKRLYTPFHPAVLRELRDVIPGEEFTIFEPRTLAAFQRCPDLRKDPDLERHNNGITVVVL